jgi:hypothetical protein
MPGGNATRLSMGVKNYHGRSEIWLTTICAIGLRRWKKPVS